MNCRDNYLCGKNWYLTPSAKYSFGYIHNSFVKRKSLKVKEEKKQTIIITLGVQQNILRKILNGKHP